MKSGSNNHGHVLPLRVYLTVGAALFVLTGITVWVSTFNLGPYNLVVAMIIAATKGLLVAFFFMHLFYDNKLYFMIFGFAIAFIAIFIVLTMFDTQARADVNPIEGRVIQPEAAIYEQKPALSPADSSVHK
ncbi:cytochrome-c oxidase [candidate division GN15 bacterium]|uniref:Cytochrome-c oxidase n=1 Tax=candidate division GN15 bacterium TaxID=2072418 RepID=A0A855X8F2_9BACT|nr:MAG: cytochrome-c oxidase [candidate division GN15 bacterium]